MHAKNHEIESAWDVSTYGATLDYLKKTVLLVYESEFFEYAAPGSRVDGVMNQDVQILTFDYATLDLITSNQVF